jgi:hypothetical protein
MPYTINRTNGAKITVVNDGTINNSALDITLIGKNYTGYGEAFNENFVKLLENFSSTSRPAKPLTGQLYFNSTSKKLEVYTTTGESRWKTLGVIDVGTSRPTGANAGDLWFNPNDSGGRLYSYSGSGNQWILIGPINARGQTSGAISLDVKNQDSGLPENVLKLVANDGISFIASTRPSFDVDASETDIEPFFQNQIKQGITLPGADSDGVSYDPSLNNGYLMWGTAGTSLGLVRSNGDYVNADQYLTQQELSSAVGSVTVNEDAGVLIGVSGILKLHITEPDNTANISVINGNARTLKFNIRNGTDQFYNIFSITTGSNNDPRILPNSSATVYIGTASQAFSYGYINTLTSLTADIRTISSLNITGTNLTATNITSVNLTSTNITNVNLTSTNITNTNLNSTNITNVNLTATNITSTRLTATNITSVNLTATNITSTNLTSTNITSTNLTATNITATTIRSTQIFDGNSRVLTTTTGVISIAGTTNKILVNGGTAVQVGVTTLTLPDTLDITVQSLRSTGSTQVFGTWTLASGATFQATYADLAERYHADQPYYPGTVLVIGGHNEVTTTVDRANTAVAGIVSTNPAYTLNAQAGDDTTHPYIALKGRVPCRVIGPILKGDLLVTSAVPGYAERAQTSDHPTAVLGRALEEFGGAEGVIEVMVI